MNLINFAKEYKGGGVQDAYPQQVDNLPDLFLEPFNSQAIHKQWTTILSTTLYILILVW